MSNNDNIRSSDVAIIGLACRFPGAKDVETFWQNLRNGVETIRQFSDDELEQVDLALRNHPRYVKAGAVLPDIDYFDADFFGYSAKEAALIDPQQRVFLECAWEALEQAGYPPDTHAKRVGVYAGASISHYLINQVIGGALFMGTRLAEFQATLANDRNFLATRISYKLNLDGPSVNVQAACSTGLVTVHLACQSLLLGECDLALAGSVSIKVPQKSGYLYEEGLIFSPDGHCRAFDTDAQGTLFGNGAGVVVLKLLQDALGDGDEIIAVIKGSAVNNDGANKVGFTSPSVAGQASVISEALAIADVTPQSISYIEAHGTGTRLGDPIEVAALTQAFARQSGLTALPPCTCAIGSVKTNIGHLEEAAGIAGLIKTALALYYKELPASLNFTQLNPEIDITNSPFYVNSSLKPWSSDNEPRRAGVSSFGMGGTNCHIVLEEAPAQILDSDSVAERPWHLLNLSAKSAPALQALARRYCDFLHNQPASKLPHICYTANNHRKHFDHRLSIAGESITQIRDKLLAYINGQTKIGLSQGTVSTRQAAPKIAFLFTGQGSQYINMGRELYDTQPVFRVALDRCDQMLRPSLEAPLLSVVFQDDVGAAHDAGRLNQTAYTQPALFALEYALAELWLSWGVQPDVLLGHSVGEIVAACIAGVFSLADGLKLIAARGRLMQALPQHGAMVSVLADEPQVRAAIAPHSAKVSIAAINGPKHIVISGQREAVLEITQALAATGIETRPLTVSHAFHSPLMDSVLAEFRQIAETITYTEPTIALISNVTGQPANAEIATADYWVRHVRQAVRFADGVATLHRQGVDVLIEIGPKPTLLGLARQAERPQPGHQPIMLPSLRAGRSDWQQMLHSLGELYVRGITINWPGFDHAFARRKVSLPTYPFQRQRHWVEPVAPKQPTERLRPLIDKQMYLPRHRETIFEIDLSVERLPFLDDHRIYEAVVVPGAYHLAMALSAAELKLGQQAYQIADVVFPEALVLPPETTRTAQVIFNAPNANGSFEFSLISFDPETLEGDHAEKPTTHALGHVSRLTTQPEKPWVALDALRDRTMHETGLEPLNVDDFYQAIADTITFGSAFRWVTALYRQQSQPEAQTTEAWGKLSRPAIVAGLEGYAIHPGLLDACFQVASVTRQFDADGDKGQRNEIDLPFALTSLRLYDVAQGDEFWCYVRQAAEYRWDVQLYNHLGQIIVEIEGFETRSAPKSRLQSERPRTDWLYTFGWEAVSVAAESETKDPAQAPDAWLILGGHNPLSRKLVAQLQVGGPPTVLVTPGDRYTLQAADEFQLDYQATVNPLKLDDFSMLLGAMRERQILTGQGLLGVVFLWGVDNTSTALQPPAQALHTCGSLLHLVQALTKYTGDARLWLVTQNGQTVTGSLNEPGRAQIDVDAMARRAVGGAVGSLGRTIGQEFPAWHCSLVDLDDLSVEQSVSQLHQTLKMSASDEQPSTQLAYRQNSRYVGVLKRWQRPASWQNSQPQRLVLSEYGSIDNLTAMPMRRQRPGPSEIEIAVQAAGLNFRDLLNALGMLKEYYAAALGIHQAQAVPLGFECAGIVAAVGDGVTGLAVGDRVMALADGSFASYVTVSADAVAPIPDGTSFEEAATIPLAFLTAWYGLTKRAKLQAGERVLIHAAAGGVGQAAVQIAQALGAEVYGTASKGKWEFLRTHDVEHIHNSRTLDFASEILQHTDGAGVNVILNSLRGDFIDHSFEILADQGRFVELGKIGIWAAAEAQARRPDVGYHAFDLGEAMARDPNLCAVLWQELTDQFTAGTLEPLPYTMFSVSQIANAFRMMQQARHIGKIVISFESPKSPKIHEAATYLITGGVGALGLQVAQQLAEDGAKHLVLSSRRGLVDEAARETIAGLAETGTHVTVIQADVAEQADVAQLIAQCQAIAPLKGIVHAAGVLDDGVLTQQTLERFEAVMRPKVVGSWHLHTMTQTLALDFFVCFSSVTSLQGAIGQSNYAAANGFMDSLMQQRYARGLAGLSINWGPWAEAGMAANLQHRGQAADIAMISPPQGRRVFQHVLQLAIPQIGVLPQKPQPSASVETRPATPKSDIRQTLINLPDRDDQINHLDEYLRAELAAVLGLDSSAEINTQTPLADFGLDSLMSIELKNKLEVGLRCSLHPTLLLNYPTLAVLTPRLLDHVLTATGEEMI